MIRALKGTAFIELMLSIIPFLAITMGGFEYLWFIHCKQSLTAAATNAVEFAARSHLEGQGASSNALNALRTLAQQKGQEFLSEMGFSDDFVAATTVRIDYIKDFAVDYPILKNNVPQKDKLRLVGAQVSIPWSKAMIFGDFADNVLHLVADRPDTLSTIVFNWKQWKDEAGSN